MSAQVRALVTGTSGYVAACLLPALRAEGWWLRGLDRQPGPAGAALDEAIVGDLLDAATTERALDGVSTVVHLAAAKSDWGVPEAVYMRDNVDATASLVEAGRRAGVADWIVYSTVGVHGPSAVALPETGPTRPTNAYGRSKLAAEATLAPLVADGARVIVIRPSAVFGPGHPPSTNIHRLVEAIRRRRFVMIGDGSNLKTTSHADNLVAATLFLHRSGPEGLSVWTYVDDPVLSGGAMVRRIHELLGRRPPRLRVPLRLVRTVASVSDVAARVTGIDLPITSARIAKFCAPTNYDPGALRRAGFRPPVPVDDALAATVRWHLTVGGPALR